jgi:hypothetical protein
VQSRLGERVQELAIKVLREGGEHSSAASSSSKDSDEAIAARLVSYMTHAKQLLSARKHL